MDFSLMIFEGMLEQKAFNFKQHTGCNGHVIPFNIPFIIPAKIQS